MEKYIFDQSNGLWYELQGNYYVPCLVLDEAGTSPIGMWGRKHQQYLKEHRPTFILRLQSIVGSPRGMRLLREPP